MHLLRFILLPLSFLLLFTTNNVSVFAQNSPNTIKEQEINSLIQRAETQYKLGIISLADGNLRQMRVYFDRAVEEIITAGIDIHSDLRLQTYYRELVDKIVRQQLAFNTPGTPGIEEQRYEGSPANEIARITEVELEEVTVKTPPTTITKSPTILSKSELPHSVNQFISYFTAGKGRRTLEVGFTRAGKYRKYVEKIFAEQGVPTELIWLAQVESLWQPVATSYASARGIWQFIPSTGLRFGLRQDNWLDERLDPEKSTVAAARYLRFLADRYAGDWLLAMAAYNCGENGLDRAIARCGYADYWILRERGYLPSETRNYVPAILAVMVIAQNPEIYGLQSPLQDKTWEFERITVAGNKPIANIASTLRLSTETVASFNPELTASVTPPIGHLLRIPKGVARELIAQLNEVPTPTYQTRRVVKRQR